MTKRPPTLRDLIRQRQAAEFVGREPQLGHFEENLGLPIDDPRRRFLYSIHGDAGTGKTTLVQQLVRLAREGDHATAVVDESYYDLVGVLEQIASELGRQGIRCKALWNGLETYKQRRNEVESDPGTPEGLSSTLTRSAVRIGLHAASDVPVVGAVANELDVDEIAQQADRLRVFLSRKFRSSGDVALLMNPVAELTPLLLQEISSTASEKPVALFFDTFERTRPYVEPWLLDVLAERYGPLPPTVVLTISGQHALDINRWGDYLVVREDVALDVFTLSEARSLLTTRGVTDDGVVDTIIELSGRLPLLVAMLAESRPESDDLVGDPSGSAVERFLRWESDERRRTAALHGALPRRLDLDIFSAATESSTPQDDFSWLVRLPFVSEHAAGFRYHNVVRTSMLRVLRGVVPSEWARRHNALVAYYAAHREATGLIERRAWKDERWQALRMEELYHRLCVGEPDVVGVLCAAVIDAIIWRPSSVSQWRQLVEQVGAEVGGTEVTELDRALSTWSETDEQAKLRVLLALESVPELDPLHRACLAAERGETHLLLDQPDRALSSFEQALRLADAVDWILVGRARVHIVLARYDEALADLTRALEVSPGYRWALELRGKVYRIAGRLDEALTDLTTAVENDPGDKRAIAERGETLRLMGHYEDAVADFTRAIEIDPEDAWAIGSRGQAHIARGREEAALTDFDRAIDIMPTYKWLIAERGLLHQRSGRHGDAVADFTRAVALDPEYDWAFALRGNAHTDVGRYEEAIADFTRAIELRPDSTWTITERGRAHREAGRYEDAIADFTRAIEIDPEYDWAVAQRGEAHAATGDRDAAITDFSRAIEIDAGSAWTVVSRGELYAEAGDHEAALADFTRAIDLIPSSALGHRQRGRVHRTQGHYADAVADFTRAAEIEPQCDWDIAHRGEAHAAAGEHEAAFTDLSRAIDMDPAYSWAYAQRGGVCLLMGRYDEADADLSRAIELDPECAGAHSLRGETRRLLGRFEEAMVDLERAYELDDDGWSWYQMALTHLATGNRTEAERCLDRAVDTDRADVARNPDHHWAMCNVAVYLAARGQDAEALSVLREAIAAGPDGETLRDALRDFTGLRDALGIDVAEPLRLLRQA